MPEAARSPLSILAVAATALGLLAAGCGGEPRRAETVKTVTQASPAPATTATGPVVPAKATDPVRRAYIARVDRICAHLDPERGSARERVGKSGDRGDAEEAAVAYDDSIALGEKQLRQIEAVRAPSRDRAPLEANVFGVIRRQLAVRRKIRAALAAHDLTQLTTLRRQHDDLTRSLVGFARGYGFQVCGED